MIVIDPDHPPSRKELDDLHEAGVRAIRVNLKSVGKKLPSEDLAALLTRHADIIRPMNTWAIQVYADLATFEGLEPLLPDLGVKLVIDHFASPEKLEADSSAMPGWNALLKMMRERDTYVKISAPYRLSKDPDFKDLEPLFRDLVGVRNGERVVFATDWPHTVSHTPSSDFDG